MKSSPENTGWRSPILTSTAHRRKRHRTKVEWPSCDWNTGHQRWKCTKNSAQREACGPSPLKHSRSGEMEKTSTTVLTVFPPEHQCSVCFHDVLLLVAQVVHIWVGVIVAGLLLCAIIFAHACRPRVCDQSRARKSNRSEEGDGPRSLTTFHHQRKVSPSVHMCVATTTKAVVLRSVPE